MFTSKIEANEFKNLVAEVKAMRFIRTAQVSDYIVKNKLGQKYQHISGVVTMQAEGRDWRFVGGFPPRIYAKLCEALGLSSNGSRAKVIDFRSFKQLALV